MGFCDTSGNPSAAKVCRAARIILSQPGIVGYFGSGSGVASGDINDDGVDDLIISALLADPGGRTDAGEVYVIFGEAQQTPTAAFSPTATTTGDAPLTVQFTDTSSGNPTSWLWNFGDGATSSQRNPSHTYDRGGVFTVNLVVSNNVGSDTGTKFGLVNVTGLLSKIVFDSARDGKNEIYTMNPDGASKTPLSAGVIGEPSHLLHGDQRWFLQVLVIPGEFYPDGGQRREIFAVNENGLGIQLTDQPELFIATRSDRPGSR